MSNNLISFKPKFSIICLIYKSTEWLDFVYNQVIKYTDLTESEFFFIANNATDEVKKYLKDNYIPHFIYDTNPELKNEWYINNVYRGYNYGAIKAKGEYIIFINSDMAFSKDWLINLYNKINGKNCIASRLVESGKFRSGEYGIEKNFGTEFFEFNEDGFQEYASVLNEKGIVKNGGLYMPLLIKKEDFINAGMYPEGNIKQGSDLYNPVIATKEDKISYFGDKALIEKLRRNGIEHVTSFDSLVYHFQAGELTYENLKINQTKTNICIYNDIVTGTMGEKVLWDFLIEKLPGNVYGIDKRIVGDKGNLEDNVNEHISEFYPKTDLIIQNATFISKMNNNIPTICYLQDDIRKMGQNSLLQEENLKNCDLIVTNSEYTKNSYNDYNSEIIPIGVNEELFKILNKKDLRLKYKIPDGNVGIFVGSLTETKGWNEIEKIILSNKLVKHWIIITKYEEKLNLINCTLFIKVPQSQLVELLNCADFFILGSKVETQCLAAIEAALCNLPIVMREIGIFKEFSEEQKRSLGIFGEDLEKGIKEVLENINSFSPRNTIINNDLTVNSMIKKWENLISRFILIKRNKFFLPKEEKIYNPNKLIKFEIFFRKKILGKVGMQNFSFKLLIDINFYKGIIYKFYKKITGK